MESESPDLAARKRITAIVEALVGAHDRLMRRARVLCAVWHDMDATELLHRVTTELLLSPQYHTLDPVAYVKTRMRQLASNATRDEPRRRELRADVQYQTEGGILVEPNITPLEALERSERTLLVRTLVDRLDTMAEARGYEDARMLLMAWQQVAESDREITRANVLELSGINEREYRNGRDQISRLVQHTPRSLLVAVSVMEGDS